MATKGYSSIQIEVKVGSTALNYVQEIGQIGGAPEQLDTTCFKDTMKTSVPGVQDAGAWEITCLYDNSAADSDYRKLKALADAGEAVPVEVTFPDGTKFEAEGIPSVYVDGVGTNAVPTLKVSVSLSEGWTVTNPTTTS